MVVAWRLPILSCIALLQGLVHSQHGEVAVKRSPGATRSPGFCTSVSFSYPGWELTGLLITKDRIDFRLVNNAKPDINITCSGGSADPPSSSYRECSDRHTRFHYEAESAVLSINQEWTCEETGLAFLGVGNTTTDCSSLTDTCRLSGGKSILGSLLAPVQISPSPVPVPVGADKAGCTSSSRTSPGWEVINLVYSRRDLAEITCWFSPVCTPNRQPGWVSTIEFDLVNTVTGDRRYCSATGARLSDVQQDYGPYRGEWESCEGGNTFVSYGSLPVTKAHQARTFFRFNHTSNALELNQTWYCNDLGDHDEYALNAVGSVSPALNPSVRYVGNASLGQINVNAASPSLDISGRLVGDEKLPTRALERPEAFGHSCTISVLLNPPTHLRIFEFRYIDFWKNASARTGRVYMFVDNFVTDTKFSYPQDDPGHDFFIYETYAESPAMLPGIPGVSDPSVWYGCDNGNSAVRAGELFLRNCSFAFDRATNLLSVREDWICADKDHGHP